MSEIAQTFYIRILEAARQDRPVDAVRDFRVVLESIFRQLTSGDPRTFSNLFGRIEYVFDMMNVKPLMREQIHSLRILANKLSHEPMPLEHRKYLLSLRAICETVEYFYEAPVPDELKLIYAELGDAKFVRPKYQDRKPQEVVPLIKALVLKVDPLQEIEAGGKYFAVSGREATLGDFTVQLWQAEQNDLTYLQPLLQPYDTLQLLNVRKLDGQENRYTSIAQTQAVLEPDLLMDISDLAECFSHKGSFPMIFLLKKLLPQTSSKAAFQGNLVNTLLDEAIRTPHPDYKDAFKRTVAEKVFMAAAYGKTELNELYTNIKGQHWDNVLSVADSYRNHLVRIEPTFFSAKYGLQGRLDLMIEYANDPWKKDIIELKSGSPPDNGLWRNNEMQVVGYNMLLASTFGERRTGSSAILYSRGNGNPLRNVTSNLLVENRLLSIRNQAVAWLLQLAAGRMEVLDLIHPALAEGLPSFSKSDFTRFQETWTQASDTKKSYYKAYLAFVLREFLNAKCGIYSAQEREEEGDGFAALWLQDEEDKGRHFSILRRLSFTVYEASNGAFRFQVEGDPQNHNFRKGDTVLIYPRTPEGLQPLRQQVVKGRLDEIRPHEVLISPNNRQLDASYFQQHADWVMEHDIFESNFWQTTQGLFRILEPGNDRLFKLLSGVESPQLGSIPNIEPNGLNENQRDILGRALAAPDYFLVQGPPGTGKTSSFLTNLVKEQLKQPGTIVIVAFTNRAVEEISQRLEAKGISFLRLGGKQVKSEIELRDMILQKDVEGAREHIKKHRVFLSTVATMTGRMEGLRMLKDDLQTLIVDESSQLTEPQLLSLLPDFKRFILIGDQNQLPPVVAQDSAFCPVKSATLQAMGISDLRYSLFERLMDLARRNNWSHAWGMLNTHFRMHRDIAALINHWYGGQLVCGRDEQQEPHVFNGPEGPWKEVLSAGRAVFVPSPREMTSKYHRTEAERVVSLLHYLREAYGPDFGPDLVGVITPWRTQIGLIRSLIGNDEELQSLNIDTVERFQGSENDIIIVSFAVYHPAQMELLRSPGKFVYNAGEEGLQEIEVDRKLLVTLSRARKQVVVLGDEGIVHDKSQYSLAFESFCQRRYQ